MRVEDSETLTDFAGFEDFLQRRGPWVCGMDFPFGQPRSLIAALGWPSSWEGYVGEVGKLPKEEFEGKIRADMATRPAGRKWRYRLADRRSGSSSAMMLFRVPVGKMFYQGAPRLLASGVRIEPCRRNGDAQSCRRGLPGGRRPPLSGTQSIQEGRRTRHTRKEIRQGDAALRPGVSSHSRKSMDSRWRWMLAGGMSSYGTLPPTPSDSLLCAVQAAWAYVRRDEDYGVPPECDPEEGWILDPALLDE